MGFVNRHGSDGDTGAGTTVVAANSVIVGELAVSDHLLVDGRVEGRVRADLQVSIGRTGVVQGELSARHVIVCGRFEGSINADRREIRSEEHTSELQSRGHLVCRLLLEQKK